MRAPREKSSSKPARRRKKVPQKKLSDETLHRMECLACPLDCSQAKSSKMEPSGSNAPTLYVLGEAPGQEEDERDEPFVGASGRMLRRQFPGDWKRDIRFNNCVRTRPPNNRTPEHDEIECCRPSVIRDIEKMKPDAILAVGGTAANWALQSSGGIMTWRGRRAVAKIGKHTCWVFPVNHPAFLLRGRIGTDDERVFKQDIKRTLHWLDKEYRAPPKVDTEEVINDNIRVFLGDEETSELRAIERALDQLGQEEYNAFDYETSHLRPYADGSVLISVAIGIYDCTIAFPIHSPQSKFGAKSRAKIEDIYLNYLQSDAKKIAHNLAFELEWTGNKFGKDFVRASDWEDTMAQAYVLDERRGGLSLEFCCVQHLGVPIKQFAGLNRKNMLSEPLNRVLWYNGRDTKYTHRLFLEQKKAVDQEKLASIYEEHVRRIPTFVLAQLFGITVDFDRNKKLDEDLVKQIADAEAELMQEPAAKRMARDVARPLKLGSTQDMQKLLRDYAKIKAGSYVDKETGEEKYTTNKKTMAEVEHPVAKKLTSWRELTKLRSTYVVGLAPDGKYVWPDQLVHPQFNTLRVATGRTSCEDPNGQNFPSRKNKHVRAQIRAVKKIIAKQLGVKVRDLDGIEIIVLSADFGQQEARVIGMASKDKFLCKSLFEGYDIHMEWAERLAYEYPARIGGKAMLKDKDVMKKFRTDIKNQWTFPAFFGAMDESIAGYLEIPLSVVKPVFREFWKTFSGVKEWQENLMNFYRDNGYVECLTGRRRHAPMTSNELINSPIQGTASDIVVDAMNRLSELADKSCDWQYQARLNIHDDLTFFLLKDDKYEERIKTISTYMLDCQYDFINVPLQVELKAGPDWYDQKEIAVYTSHEYIKGWVAPAFRRK